MGGLWGKHILQHAKSSLKNTSTQNAAPSCVHKVKIHLYFDGRCPSDQQIRVDKTRKHKTLLYLSCLMFCAGRQSRRLLFTFRDVASWRETSTNQYSLIELFSVLYSCHVVSLSKSVLTKSEKQKTSLACTSSNDVCFYISAMPSLDRNPASSIDQYRLM